MGIKIQDGRGGFYQREKGKPASISAGGSVAADTATTKN